MQQRIGQGKVGINDPSYEVVSDGLYPKVGALSTGAGYYGGSIKLCKMFGRTRSNLYFYLMIIGNAILGISYLYKLTGKYLDYAIHFRYKVFGISRGFYYFYLSCYAQFEIEVIRLFSLFGAIKNFSYLRYKIYGYAKATASAILSLTGSVKRNYIYRFLLTTTLQHTLYFPFILQGKAKVEKFYLISCNGIASIINISLFKVHGILEKTLTQLIKIRGDSETTKASFNFLISGTIKFFVFLTSLSMRVNKIEPPSRIILFNDNASEDERRYRR